MPSASVRPLRAIATCGYPRISGQLELANHALAIDREVNLPIMLYNYPGRTGTKMQGGFFDRIYSDSI